MSVPHTRRAGIALAALAALAALCLAGVGASAGAGAAGATPIAEARYGCQPEGRVLHAAYDNSTRPPTVVIDYDGRRWTLLAARSASGARYARGPVEAWEHQGELSFNDGRRRHVCRLLPQARPRPSLAAAQRPMPQP